MTAPNWGRRRFILTAAAGVPAAAVLAACGSSGSAQGQKSELRRGRSHDQRRSAGLGHPVRVRRLRPVQRHALQDPVLNLYQPGRQPDRAGHREGGRHQQRRPVDRDAGGRLGRHALDRGDRALQEHPCQRARQSRELLPVRHRRVEAVRHHQHRAGQDTSAGASSPARRLSCSPTSPCTSSAGRSTTSTSSTWTPPTR